MEHEARPDAIFGDLEDGGLGAVQQRVGLFLRVQSRLLDRLRGVNQTAQQRLLFNDPGVMFQIRNTRDAVDELREISRSARGLEFSLAAKLVAERNQVDGLLRLAQLDHVVEDAPVLIGKEIFRLELFNRRVQRVIIEEDGAKHAALGFQILR